MINLIQKLKQTGRKALVVGGLGVSVLGGGCTMNPSEFQSYIIGSGPTERERQAAIQGGVRIPTPEGYEVNLYKGATVYYGGEKVYVLDISPPNIELAKFKYNPRHVQKGTWIDIKQLDMFRGNNTNRPNTTPLVQEEYRPKDDEIWFNPKGTKKIIVLKKRRVEIYNYWEDFDGDGSVNYPEELVGLNKKRFRDNEMISIVVSDGSGKEGDKLEQRIFGPKGELVFQDEKIYDSNDVHIESKINNDCLRGFIKDYGYGTYKYTFSVNEKYADSKEFEIIPSE